MAVLTALLLGTLSVASAQSYQYITTNNLPADGLQDACKTALTKNITCSQATSRFIGGRYYRPEDLARVCTSSCRSALGDYHNGVAQACGNTSYAYDANNVRPVAAISYGLLHNYELACLNNNNQWCNSIVFNKALQADPTAPPDPGLTPNNATVSDCDLCLIKSMKLQAESALEKSPEPAAHYSSVTAKCKVTNLPLSSSTLPTAKTSSTITSATPSTTCAGSTYQVKSGDTCRSIAVAQKIGVGWLVNDNPAKLGAYCAGFKDTLGSLCVADTCKTYTVKTSDTCKSIAKANNVTAVQLISWNPFLNEGCGNLDYSKGDSICISKPGKPYVEPPTPPVATSFTTAAPVPTNVARNTTSKCGKYYTVVPNDYCNLLCVRFQLTLDDFLFLNPAVNVNCTNLYAQESYCVAPVGKITDYPGHPGYVAPITEKPPSAYTAFPKATYTFTAPNLPKKLPIANQTRTECYTFVDGTNLQADYKAAFYRSACEMYMQIYHVSAEALQNWNPSLDPSSASCKFDPSYRYCMVAYDPASVPMTTAKTISDSPVPSSTSKGPTAPAPTQSGQPSNCNKWFVPKSGDSCDTAEKSAGITDAQFHAWNPAVSADCTQGFWADTAYCVGVSGGTSSSSATSIKTSSTSSIKTSSTSIKTTSSTTSSKTSSKATTTTQAAAPSPTQPNSISSKCNKYAKAVSGSSCYSMAQDNGITLTKLGLWNTVLGTDGANCSTQYWLDYYYCVGVSA